MKFQNKEVKDRVTIINSVLLIIFLTSLIFSYIDLEALKDSEDLISFVSFITMLYLSYLGCPFFRYDSEGETLILQNKKSFIFSPLVKEKLSDFPKTKVRSFITKHNLFFKKKLDIYITSNRSKSGVSKLTFDVSYLSRQQIKNIETSLSKILNENRKIFGSEAVPELKDKHKETLA